MERILCEAAVTLLRFIYSLIDELPLQHTRFEVTIAQLGQLS